MIIRSRRSFLQIACRSAVTLGAASGLGRFGAISLRAQSSTGYRALVCVFLYGGNDGNGMIIPLSSADYAQYSKVRGYMAIPSSSLLPVTPATGTPFGLHPKLTEIRDLFVSRKAAILANVGVLVRPLTRSQYLAHNAPVPASLFSHGDQQLQWETGVPNSGNRTGWAGRTADILGPLNGSSAFPTAVSVAATSTFCNGNNSEAATVAPGRDLGIVGLDGSPSAQSRQAALQQLLTFDSGFSLVQAANSKLRQGIEIDNLLNGALSSSSPLATPFPDTSLGQQLQQIAQIIKVRSQLGMSRQIFFCALGGFDTHFGQDYYHNLLYAELSGALAAFYRATEEMGVSQQVTTFTESEFGRTLQPSSNGGTDHAWGNHHIVMGGAVKGGDLYGRFPELALSGPDDAGNRGTWIPTLSLDEYGSALAKWFGVSSGDLPKVFPNLANFPANTLSNLLS